MAFSVTHPGLTAEWAEASSYLVLLSVADEPGLVELAGVLEGEGVTVVEWREPDWDGQLTAAAVAPHPSLRRLLARCPLTLREPAMA